MSAALSVLGVVAFLGLVVGAVGLFLGLVAAFTSPGGPTGDGARSMRWAKFSGITLGIAALLLGVFVILSLVSAPVM